MAGVRIPWVLTDPFSADTVQFAINPLDADSLPLQKTITYQQTAAPDGRALVFQGRDAAIQMTFSGTILEQSEYDMFVTWYNKQNQVTVTDDLGRSYDVVITAFKPKRVRSIQYPWKHSYDLDVTVV